MKFLVDECLHTSLVVVAHEAGHVCDHVNFLGLGGYKDWQLMAKIRAEDCTLVTNNRADFVALFAKEALHSGLLIILPSVTPLLQRQLFCVVLMHIGTRDLINTVLEAELIGTTTICCEYLHPTPLGS